MTQTCQRPVPGSTPDCATVSERSARQNPFMKMSPHSTTTRFQLRMHKTPFSACRSPMHVSLVALAMCAVVVGAVATPLLPSIPDDLAQYHNPDADRTAGETEPSPASSQLCLEVMQGRLLLLAGDLVSAHGIGAVALNTSACSKSVVWSFLSQVFLSSRYNGVGARRSWGTVSPSDHWHATCHLPCCNQRRD